MNKTPFGQPLALKTINPDFGERMTIEDFRECVRLGTFIDDDGCGFYATASNESNVYANPSDIAKGIIDSRFTHVIWYNK